MLALALGLVLLHHVRNRSVKLVDVFAMGVELSLDGTKPAENRISCEWPN